LHEEGNDTSGTGRSGHAPDRYLTAGPPSDGTSLLAPCHTAAMATFTISARADQTGFDVEIECGNDGRQTTRDFKTQEDAETWVVRRMQLIDRTDRSAQSGFRMLWRIR
jgi:hypothetical protein